MPFSIEATDLLTIGLLVLLEAVLSADNALVLAVLVLPLPRELQKRALRYGILGAIGFRVVATLFAAHLISWTWVKLAGGAYLLHLPFKHFTSHPNQSRGSGAVIKPLLGLTIFWSTVVRVEVTDIVFAIDSILVAVAMSRKIWVVITGGVLGIITMRILIGTLLGIVRRFPKIVDGAYVIVAWVGLKLLLEYSHAMHWIGWEIPRWLAITIMLTLFAGSALYAVRHEAKPPNPGRGGADQGDGGRGAAPSLDDPAELLK
jgi:YkoY family integral membrane protein